MLAVVLEPLARERLAQDLHVLARALRAGLAKRWPCQPSATCGPDEPIPRIMRPPESWSSVAAVIAVIAGERPGIWKIAEPSRIRSVCAGEPGEHGGGVGAVGLGGPDGVEAGALGCLDQLELLLGGEAQAPIADVQPESHATLLSPLQATS